MDWGLITLTRTGTFYFRQRILYHPIIYILASAINLFLRFSWKAPSLPFFGKLHTANLIILLQISEVLRRSMWNMLRIEWEVIVQQDKVTSSKEKEWNYKDDGINNNINNNSNNSSTSVDHLLNNHGMNISNSSNGH